MMIYEKENQHSSKVIRGTASNMLASRISDIRTDLCRGKAFEEANSSILVRALMVTTQNGFIYKSVYTKGVSR